MTAASAPVAERPALESAGRIAAFASLSFREAYRSRSFIVAIVLNLLLLGLMALVAFAIANQQSEDFGPILRGEFAVRVFLWFAVGSAYGLALFVGVFSSVGAIAGEIERGTILAVVARPVARWEIVLGKLIGYASLSVTYLLVEAFAIAAIAYAVSGVWVMDLLPYLALVALNITVMVAVSLLGSTRLSTVAGAVLVVVAFIALTNTGLLFTIGALLNSDILKGMADWSRLLLPVGLVSDRAGEVILGPAAELVQSTGGPGSGGASAFLLPSRGDLWPVAIVYLVIVVVLSAVSLSRRDLRGG